MRVAFYFLGLVIALVLLADHLGKPPPELVATVPPAAYQAPRVEQRMGSQSDLVLIPHFDATRPRTYRCGPNFDQICQYGP